MIPFNVNVDGKKETVGISWESLFWFFIVTAGATVLGEFVYTKWVQPYLNPAPPIVPITPPTNTE